MAPSPRMAGVVHAPTRKGLEALSPVQNAMLGMTAGTIEIVVLQPMLYCKNATQQNLALTLNPAMLYRGVVTSATNMAIITGVQFPLTGVISKIISGGKRSLTDGERLAAAFTGGTISGLVCSPMELVMIQQQRYGGSVIGTPARIISQTGAGTLYRGLLPTMLREGLFTMGYMTLGSVLAKKITDTTGLTGFVAAFAGSSLGGVIAATLSHPFDTIKTCQQGDIERKTYGTLKETTQTLYEQGGARRFFSGWAWRTSRMICAIFIIGQLKEHLAPVFFPSVFAGNSELPDIHCEDERPIAS